MLLLAWFLAVAIGLLVGVLGRLATRRYRTVSGRVMIAVSVGAALLGAGTAEMSGSRDLGRFVLPTLLAMMGVGLTVMMTARPRADPPGAIRTGPGRKS
ncbi:hypothetical protein [Catenuloplanes indicus]|uniref:Uncharacterized protein n=1 Tax=Catenuloplanes indicus TaxID=137267 RepID=A0AAE4AYL2_9ACTN|nr:hypothetical protein [Catenuloplanes indicus]MDQ0365163.1 hypothetical protein [Catenuloplanes indicus]